jgi:probable rRNA maturation factor
MSGVLWLRNRQRTRRLDLRLLRRIACHLLTQHFGPKQFELGLHLVGTAEMAKLNERFLRHAGPTDVLTFNNGEPNQRNLLLGEVFICLDEAVAQGRRFRTTWQSELARYLIHGLLHLRGHDDSQPAARRKMKREENRLLREVARQFPLRRLQKPKKLAPLRSAFRIPQSAVG